MNNDSDLDSAVLFLLRIFEIYEITLPTLLLSARSQHYNANSFSDESDFSIVYQFNIMN